MWVPLIGKGTYAISFRKSDEKEEMVGIHLEDTALVNGVLLVLPYLPEILYLNYASKAKVGRWADGNRVIEQVEEMG